MCLDIPANRPGFVPNAVAFAPAQQQPYQPLEPPHAPVTTNCSGSGGYFTCTTNDLNPSLNAIAHPYVVHPY
jgi:hypothetical protein